MSLLRKAIVSVVKELNSVMKIVAIMLARNLSIYNHRCLSPALIKGQILRITYRRIRPVGSTGRIRLDVISPIIMDD